MRRLMLVGSLWLAACAAPAAEAPAASSPAMQTRLIASGLRGAYGIRQVGRFHGGGPFTSNPEFLLQTQGGRVLDPERVLVALGDNLGAVPADPSQAAGAVVSIDPRAASLARPIVVPRDLALRPSPPGSPVLLYSVQSARYSNRLHNGGARTADATGVSGPRYLSLNNAFGRPWVANAPWGPQGAGSESVLDPDGAPLANAPSDVAGGVFVGTASARTSVPKAVRVGWWASLLNRQPSGQLTPGAIDRGAFGTALLGSSPDGSGFAVFAVVTGTGAVVQVHVQDGVDGLAPAGTIDVGGEDPGVVGIAFKWSPDRALFVADARRNRIVVLQLADDTRHFRVARTAHLSSPAMNRPVDLAACVPEVANPRFASHTTLAGGSDLYVVNRGDGSLLRLRQDGTVVARRMVQWPDGRPVGADRLRSLAVSADAQRLWLVAEQGGGESVLLEGSGFDAAGSFGVEASAAKGARPSETASEGARLFALPLTPGTGLGPLFNADSCIACHPGPGGASAREEHFARRVARMEPSTGRILALDGQPSALAPQRSSVEPGAPGAGLPRAVNVVSLRMPLSLRASGRLEEIADSVIEAQAVSKGDGIKGRVHYVAGADTARRVGRYGWKADVATLDTMVAEALGQEMGMTSALAVHPVAAARDDGTLVRSLSNFIRALGATPSPRP